MSVSETLIITGGVLSIVMALFHTRYPKMFNWKKDLESTSVPNQQILYTIHVALLLILIGLGLLSIICSSDLAKKEGLSLGFLPTLSSFWGWRAVWQIMYFKIPKNVEKKPILHYVLFAYSALQTSFYLIPIFL